MRQIVQYWINHPLASKRIPIVLIKFIWWQIISRLKSKVIVQFASKSKLLVSRSMTGATGNIYCGLHEFSDMGFLLHALRDTDCFLDVGANIGSYSILASSEIGSKVHCFEPIPSTFAHLKANIELNRVSHLCSAHNKGVGENNDSLTFTSDRDTVNHVSTSGIGISVPVVRLDDCLLPNKPLFIKVDVEGYETYVINGGATIFEHNHNMMGLIIELNGSGQRYGESDMAIHEKLIGYDFASFFYDPLKRSLLPTQRPGDHNTIYIKKANLSIIEARLVSAPKRKVLGITF